MVAFKLRSTRKLILVFRTKKAKKISSVCWCPLGFGLISCQCRAEPRRALAGQKVVFLKHLQHFHRIFSFKWILKIIPSSMPGLWNNSPGLFYQFLPCISNLYLLSNSWLGLSVLHRLRLQAGTRPLLSRLVSIPRSNTAAHLQFCPCWTSTEGCCCVPVGAHVYLLAVAGWLLFPQHVKILPFSWAGTLIVPKSFTIPHFSLRFISPHVSGRCSDWAQMHVVQLLLALSQPSSLAVILPLHPAVNFIHVLACLCAAVF